MLKKGSIYYSLFKLKNKNSHTLPAWLLYKFTWLSVLSCVCYGDGRQISFHIQLKYSLMSLTEQTHIELIWHNVL